MLYLVLYITLYINLLLNYDAVNQKGNHVLGI